jgi:ABC-type transport system substrate-binding protein
MFVNYTEGQDIVLKKNPDYWQEGIPKIEHVKFMIMDPKNWENALVNDELDFVPNLPGRYALRLLRNKKADVQVFKKLVLFTSVIMLKNQGPLADKNVRLAMNHALNKEAMVKYADFGNSIPARSSLGLKGAFGAYPENQPFEYDLQKAKDLLNSTPYKDGFTVKMLCVDLGKEIGEMIKSDLEKLNILVELEIVPRSLLIEKVVGERIRTQELPPYDLILRQVDNPIVNLAFTGGWGFFSKSSWALLNDKGYDERYIQAIQSTNMPEHEENLKRLDQYFHDEALSLFTTQRIITVVMKKNLHIKGFGITGHLDYEVLSTATFDEQPE